MCSIAGELCYDRYFNTPGEAAKAVQRTMARRGPDQSGFFCSGHCTLIHNRLSVIDPENGRQPMTLEEKGKRCTIVYNGELYNTAELRHILTQRSWRFQTHSDTEVLLASFIEWGADCLPRLNGIFAFAVWDEQEETLFLARDRMGVKPLFFMEKSHTLLFASEIKGILAHPLADAQIDAQGVAELLLMGPGRTPGCGVFSGIKELRPGEFMTVTRKGMQVKRWWKLLDAPHTETFEQTAEHVRFLVADAIERQLVSDVPIGTFLSGGLVSSLISALAAGHCRDRGILLQTFSVTYQGNDRYFKASRFQPDSDDMYIGKMADAIQNEHHTIVLDSAALTDALFSAVDARDLPGMADVDSSLLLFCREIKRHVTVALSGECADEIFGGYPWYRDQTIREQAGFPWAQSNAWRKSFLRDEFADSFPADDYLMERYHATICDTDVLPDASPEERRMKEMMRLNTDWFMQTLLDRKDRMSMYNGLEVRVPFCDHRIAEYLYRVPWNYKNYQNREKGLLRYAMQGVLPDEILWRRKSPYPKTFHPAYRALLSDKLRAVLDDPSSPIFLLCKKEPLEMLLQSETDVRWYGQLMTAPQTIAYFLQLNYWLEKYKVRIV